MNEMTPEDKLRFMMNQQTKNDFVDRILNNDNIQLHGNINTYCRQQNVDGDFSTQNNTIDYSNNAIVEVNENTELDEFKNRVKIWMRLDNEIKELNAKIKVLDNERKQRKKYIESLTPFILSFMNSNEIEELNSKEGRLLYRSSLVKTPLSQKLLKEKLYEQFENNHEQLDNIFKNRAKVEKVSLKRL